MRYAGLIIVFLLLLLPFTAMAETGETNVKVIGTDGNEVAGSVEKSENFSESNTSSDIETESSSLKVTDSGLEAGELMIVNAGKEIFFWIPDMLLQGSYELSSVEMKENLSDSGSSQYSLYSTSFDPFKKPFVENILGKTQTIYYLCAFIFICLAYWAFVTQYTTPSLFAKIQEGIAGEESFFDFKSMITSWCMAITLPYVMYYGFKAIILLRNMIVLNMTETMVKSIDVSSESWINYFLSNLGKYINEFQKLMGEYGVYLIISLLFVFSAIIVLLSIIVSLSAAVKVFCVVSGYLLIFVMIDILTLFFITFGIQLGAGYTLVGIVLAVVVGLILLTVPTIWLFFQSKFTRRFVRVGL